MVFVTEIWLKNSTVNDHLDNTDQCCIYRKDRSDRLSGGVLAFVTRSYCSYEIPVPEKFRVLEIAAHTVILSVRSSKKV